MAGRPRTKPAEERYEDIVRSAEQLFLEKGVEQTTIEDITTGADVSKGSFYLHFSSKADVVQALRARFIQHMLDQIKANVELHPDEDWDGKLAAWADACTIGYLEARTLHDLIFTAAPRPSPEGLTHNPLIDHLAELLIGGNRAGAWSLTNPAFTAVFLFSALHGVSNQTGAGNTDQKRRILIREIRSHFNRAIR